MPLMMEDDMDDLFGDGAALSLPSRPPPSKDLIQRVDELRGSGCCQTIAWSKWGSIASITLDGTFLEFRNLRCSPENGTWALSEPTRTTLLTATPDGGPLKHLSWSPTGSELAIIDSAGRVTILSIFSSLNKPALSRHSQVDPADDLHSVVGCYWLNVAPYPPNRPTILNGPAIREGSKYRYEANSAAVLGPCHPNQTKSAFVCVTTNGLLRVLWESNRRWSESQAELESVVSSDDLITHASICSDKTSTLLIAFATTSKQLCTVRAVIDWGVPKMAEKTPPSQLILQPTVKTRHLAVTSWLQDTSGETLNASHMESSMVQLSHLEFLPISGNPNGVITPPTIIAVRSHVPSCVSQYNQDVYSTVDRWEIREKPQVIHPAFEQLSSRRNSVGSQPGNIVLLKNLDSFTVNKIILAITPMNLGRVVTFAYSDSSVEYRDRNTMAEVFINDGDLDRVWHLSQLGFSYAEDEPCLQVALSPSYCSMVQLSNDGKVKWKQLEFMGDIGPGTEDAQYNAIISAFALSCSSAVMTNVNYDDLLATAQSCSKNNFAYDWLIELAVILKIQVDHSEDKHHDALVRNTTIQLFLSIHSSLGFRGIFQPRTFASKFSWLVLQLRNIVVLITMAASVKIPGPNNEKTSSLEDPEVVNALTGSVRWILDLVAWMTDTLLMLHKSLPPGMDLTDTNKFSLADLLPYLLSNNIVALHLLLSSPCRGFLIGICRRLVHIDYIARKGIQTSLSSTLPTGTANPQRGISSQQSAQPGTSVSPALRAAYLQIATLTSNSILRIKTCETFLMSVSSNIQSAYASQEPPLSEKGRNILEIKMAFGGSLPDAFKPVIVDLFRKDGLLDTVREEIEPAKLFFADFAMLEVDDDPISIDKRRRSHMTMDSFRKRWLRNPTRVDEEDNNVGLNSLNVGGRQSARWRRCARCAAVVEDVPSQGQALQWLIMHSRRCFCSGFWDTLEAGKTVA